MTASASDKSLVAPLSLLETARAIDDGKLTVQQSLQTCLDRIDAHDGTIKAYCSRLPDPLKDAEKASGPLKGIALGVKDVLDTHDLPTEHLSPIYKNHMAARDASIVAAARHAGCQLIGKTVTTEFAFFQPGETRNPHNLEHTPGGSSSGSAAAIAAGMAHLTIGTQTGGSIIRPASFCGVTGYKPSAGLLPTVGLKDFSWSLDTIGLFTATVEDVAYAASLLAKRNLRTDNKKHFNTPKLGVVRSHNWSEADKDYRNRFEDLLKSLERYGVKLVDIPTTEEFIAAFHAHQAIQDFEARQALAWEYNTHPDKLSPLLKETLDFAQTIKASDYDEARMCAEFASQQMDENFEEVDALISLSAPGPAPVGLASTGSSIFNRIWTLFGLPCVNVPGLETDKGLPLGVQIIGSYMSDKQTLQIADWIEGAVQRHIKQ